MIVSNDILNKIKQIIENHYNYLTVSVLGNSVFTPEELANLKSLGVDTSSTDSFIKSVYVHNLLNNAAMDKMPPSVREMLKQQKTKLVLTEAEAYAVEHLNQTVKGLIDKLKQDTMTNMANVVLDANMVHKFGIMGQAEKTEEEAEELKDLTLSKIKQQLRDAAGIQGKNWDRIVSTEMSNAISIASADRISKDNEGENFDQIYVYRIVKNDGKLCTYCRKFYLDEEGTPRVFTLSQLLSNGTNFGKKASSWLPVASATHPYERCSQILELKPGFKVIVGGRTTFIGLEKWKEYIKEKTK